MTYTEAKELQTRAGKFLNKELKWSNGKELIRCRFIGISGDKLTEEKKEKNYRIFAVLQANEQKRFTNPLCPCCDILKSSDALLLLIVFITMAGAKTALLVLKS